MKLEKYPLKKFSRNPSLKNKIKNNKIMKKF